ncbi:MAG: M48 family metallopeptidase [Pseudomonadota bacterium]
MPDQLEEAREFASQIRFCDDKPVMVGSVQRTQDTSIRNVFLSHELAISKAVTPELYDGLDSVLLRLNIESNAVDAFVYASPEINAQCYMGHHDRCVIRFSSALVDILSSKEFEFVVGHELGHFLFMHGQSRNENNSIEYYMQQRAQEISADRLGLIACQSLDVAIKALMKTASGLSDAHLRFDVGAFLSQIRQTSGALGQSDCATHPSIFARCRALLWFSFNEAFIDKASDYPHEEVKRLDEKVRGDLEKYVDGSARAMIKDAKIEIRMWTRMYEIIQQGKFSKSDQSAFSDEYGQDILDKMIHFLDGEANSDVEDMVFSKVKEAREELERLIPSGFNDEVKILGELK